MIARFIRLATAAALLSAVPVGVAAAASFGEPQAAYVGSAFGGVFNTLCTGVINGVNPITGNQINFNGANPVTKTVERSDNANGSSDFKVTLTGPIPATYLEADGYDCVWIDANNDGLLTPGESMRSYLAGQLTITGTGASRSITFQLNVPNAVGKSVCNVGYGVNYTLLTSNASNQSGIETGNWLYFYSNKVCSTPVPPVEIPEAGSIILLGLTGTATAAIVLTSRRRRAILN